MTWSASGISTSAIFLAGAVSIDHPARICISRNTAPVSRTAPSTSDSASMGVQGKVRRYALPLFYCFPCGTASEDEPANSVTPVHHGPWLSTTGVTRDRLTSCTGVPAASEPDDSRETRVRQTAPSLPTATL